jgi:hypothetical protein
MDQSDKRTYWLIAIIGGAAASIIANVVTKIDVGAVAQAVPHLGVIVAWVHDVAAKPIGLQAPLWVWLAVATSGIALLAYRQKLFAGFAWLRARPEHARSVEPPVDDVTERIGVLFRKSADGASRELQFVLRNVSDHLRRRAAVNDSLPHLFATLLLDTSGGLQEATERLRRSTGGAPTMSLEADLAWFYQQYQEVVRWMGDAARTRTYDLSTDENFQRWKQFDSAFLATFDALSEHVNSSYLNTAILYHSGVPAGKRDYDRYVFQPAPVDAPQLTPTNAKVDQQQHIVKQAAIDESPAKPTPPVLNPLQDRIMLLYAKQPSAKHNAVTLSPWVRDSELHVDKALETLESAGLLRSNHNIVSGTGYVLTPEGKQYLLDEGH